MTIHPDIKSCQIIDDEASNQEEYTSQETLESSESSTNNKEGVVLYEKRPCKGKKGLEYNIRRYSIGYVLGEGATATVYQCTSLETGKQYALKVIPKTLLTDASLRSSLKREVSIHHTMKHKNVCQFKRCFQGSRHVYILLELCSGGTLQHFIRNRKRLSESEAAQVMLQLVHAVDYLHSQLVIHCDIKPHNILLSPNGQVKLADFGLSYRLKHSQQKCNRSCGTPNYVAPEAIARKRHHCQIGLQADIWSLGCVLYSMLVGVPPFEAETTKETYKRIRACHYEFPSNVALSPQARDLIRSMLQADPNKRATLYKIRQHWFFHVQLKIPSYIVPRTKKSSSSNADAVVVTRRRKEKQDAQARSTRSKSTKQQLQLTIATTATSNTEPFVELLCKDLRLSCALHQEFHGGALECRP